MSAKSPSGMAVTRHPPIRDQVAAILRNAIVNLSFQPGQLLVERELCEMTGASRPSVREALRQLEAEGLVESLNGRGTVVRRLTVAEAKNVYEVRAELEGLAARLFCERADEGQHTRFQKALQMLESASGPENVLAAQQGVYQVMFEGAGNPFLDQMMRGIQDRVAQLRAVTLAVPGRAAESLAEFLVIGAEIRDRNGAAARRAASSHVDRAAEAMTKAIKA